MAANTDSLKTRSGRIIKKPDRLVKYLDHSSVDTYVKEEKEEEEKVWEIERVLNVEGDYAFVKWKGYSDRYNSTVSLSLNPQLSCYLAVNAGNPDSSEVAREKLPILCSEDKELWLTRHALFDELQFRTPENDTGLIRRVQVKVPLSKGGFSALFGKGTFSFATSRKLDFSGTRNIRFPCTAVEFGTVIGTEFMARQLPDSSTICEVDSSSKMWIS
ncbi:uncharacterized protein LOC125558976 [Nematostella vectensis]|uniref:uncharacterized protein LOC125558976 n=1 Tax=Nematostella vectensis TaxID=45351 RepID=UPI0020772372|nr:uncharacterized protein LOC125558976 [Nematostella vectensis]